MAAAGCDDGSGTDRECPLAEPITGFDNGENWGREQAEKHEVRGM